jgi:hypothetical protein
LRGDGRQQLYRIVGEDEADPGAPPRWLAGAGTTLGLSNAAGVLLILTTRHSNNLEC